MKECYQTVNESLLMSIGTAIIIAGTIFIQDSVFASQKNEAILEPIEIKGETTATTTNTTNIVLVHGSWGDGSIWSRVIPILQNAGLKVTAIQLPLESLADDIATVKRAIEHIGGPTILVGHSYGGFVITNAGYNNQNVTGLVYLAAFAPDEGESLNDFVPPESVPPGFLIFDSGGFSYINPDVFTQAFAQGANLTEGGIMAAIQKPFNQSILGEKS